MNLDQVLDVKEGENTTPNVRSVPESPEQHEEMGYLKKRPLFLGSYSAENQEIVNKILEFIKENFPQEVHPVIPVVLDQSASKQVEKYLFNKFRETSKIEEFVSLKNNSQLVTQVLAAAVKVDSLMESKQFYLGDYVKRSRHTHKTASDLLNLLFAFSFAVRWRDEKGYWIYKIISGPKAFDEFAKRRIEEAQQQIKELQDYINQMLMLADIQDQENKVIEPVVQPKKARKKKVE